MVDLTPYELNLLNEGYQERLEDAFTNADFIAYTTYASVFRSQGIEVKDRADWLKQVEEGDTKEVDPDKPVPTAVEIDAEYKRQQEALMNAMP